MKSDAKKILKIVSLSVFLLFIISYAFFRSKNLIFGVEITNVNLVAKAPNQTIIPDQDNSIRLKSGEKSVDSIIHITGNAKNAIKLTLNGRIISISQKGDFNETIALLSGYNIISIKAKDAFGNDDEKNYKLIY